MKKKNFWNDLNESIKKHDFKEKTYIGLKKQSSLPINPLLWFPPDEYKEFLRKTCGLDARTFTLIANSVEKNFKVIEPDIKIFSDDIPALFEDKTTEANIIHSFFRNKYLSDQIYSYKKYSNNEPMISPHDWYFNEFVIPNWLKMIMLGEQKKAIRIIVEQFREKNHKSVTRIQKVDERQELINKITSTKNIFRKEKSGKKVSISVVAKNLKIPYSTFTDILKKHKINFDEY